MRLTSKLHDRDAAGMTYVYPVVSRRAKGVSIGINLNPNNACNWRCVYCQVPDLAFGKGPPIDLAQLRSELKAMLEAVVHGDFFEQHVPEGSRRLNDVAFSGNGEPTSSLHFEEAVQVVIEVLGEFGPEVDLRLVLITNGSLIQHGNVERALHAMSAHRGEVWYKLDSATDKGAARLNGNTAGPERALSNLRAAAAACPTWVQTMALAWDGQPPSTEERAAYLDALSNLVGEGVKLEGVLLYGLERPSHQPEAPELAALPLDWLEAFAAEIRALGLDVRLSP